jgi:hypothetical protein
MATPARSKPILPHQDGAPAKEYKRVISIKDSKLRASVAETAQELAEAERAISTLKVEVEALKEKLDVAMRAAKVDYLEHAQFHFYRQKGEWSGVSQKLLKVALLKRKMSPVEIDKVLEQCIEVRPWETLRATDLTKKKGSYDKTQGS